MNPTSERRVYLDTSAYLAVLLGEKESAALFKEIKNATLCASTLLLLEAERNLVRLVRQDLISSKAYEDSFNQLRQDKEAFLLRDVTPDLCLNREFPPVRTPRSSDLIHLRTAKWFLENGGLAKFLSLDEAQRKAADEFGLPVQA